MKKTAQAPANIAFIKYWGKKDATLRLPYNPSISMNLSGCMTTTTVEFLKNYSSDMVSEGFNTQRVTKHIDRLRALAGVHDKARVVTKIIFQHLPVSHLLLLVLLRLPLLLRQRLG